MTTYTNPKNGATVETNLSIEEMYNALCEETSDFARKLCSKVVRGERMSDCMWYWFAKLATDKGDTGVELPEGGFERLSKLYDDVANKYPKLRFKVEGVGTVTISRGRNGVFYVRCGRYEDGTYYGKITAENRFETTSRCTEVIEKLVTAVALDPVTMAVEFGKKTGCCCFCARELTTPESVTAGYGPTCAEKWGLPWGMTGGEVIDV